jgi:hypothetical protein
MIGCMRISARRQEKDERVAVKCGEDLVLSRGLGGVDFGIGNRRSEDYDLEPERIFGSLTTSDRVCHTAVVSTMRTTMTCFSLFFLIPREEVCRCSTIMRYRVVTIDQPYDAVILSSIAIYVCLIITLCVQVYKCTKQYTHITYKLPYMQV